MQSLIACSITSASPLQRTVLAHFALPRQRVGDVAVRVELADFSSAAKRRAIISGVAVCFRRFG
jgi:hypothetical protein